MVVSEPFEDFHYDPARAQRGDRLMYIDCKFNVMVLQIPTEILPIEILKSDDTLRRMHWETQMSGVRIPDDVAAALEEVWAARVGK